MDESAYELYKITRRLIAKTEACVNHDHSAEPMLKHWKNAIEYLDKSNKGYTERYEKESRDEQVV